MSGLLPAGSGSLTDLWAPSHVCSLQPSLRRHSSLDVRSHGRNGIDSSDSGLTRRCSQHGQNLLPCLKQQQQQRLSSMRCRRPICRAASQPLPSGVHRPCLAAPRQGLRRSNSQSRLESPCRSTLAEPPVREETGGQVIHPEVVDPQKVDYDQEWSAYQRRFQSLKEVTDLTSGLMQAMEEIGSFSQTGFSAHDQAVLQSERLKHDDERKRKAQQREQRRLQEASRRMASAHQPSASPASRPSAATAPPSRWAAEISFAPAEEPQIDVSHTSVPEAEDIATSSSSSSPGSSIADGPSMSLFRRLVPIPQQQQQQQRVISSSSGKRADRQGSSAAHVTAARRSSRSVGQRSARLKQTAAASKAAETGKPAKKKMLVMDKAFPLPDSFGYMGNNHKLLSADEEKRLAVQIQSILPYEEKFDELHQANMAAAGIAEEGSDRPNAAHPDAEAGKYDPTFREWATACGRADDIPAFEHQIWEGRQARLKMLECNQRLVRSVARHFKNRGVAAEDLIMEGMQGLRRGIDKFDPNKGFKFSTYAHWWIRQAISRSICDQGRVLKVPYHICDLIAKIRKIEREMRANGTKPQPHVVAQKMGISVPRYHEILAGDANMHSLEQPLNTDGDSKSLEDMLEDDGPSMNELVVHGGLISDVNNLLHTLSPREQGVLRLRYGLDGQGERTLDDIGRFFKVTRERVRQVETKALLKLRQPMRSEALIEYTRANTQQLTWGQSGALGKKSS